jgi:hypothetical protein
VPIQHPLLPVHHFLTHGYQQSQNKAEEGYPSSCMAKLQDLFTITAGTGNIHVEADDGLVPVYAMYFSRLEWPSGEEVSEGLRAHTRFAYMLLLPERREILHSHSIYAFERSDLKMENTLFHRIVPIQSIVHPLIVDRSIEGSVTIVPFEGLDDVSTAGATSAEELAEIDWENVGDVADKSCTRVYEQGLSIVWWSLISLFSNTNRMPNCWQIPTQHEPEL